MSVQATGMGCPSAAIVIEELIQLGVKRLIRVGTCGGLQPELALGDTVVGSRPCPPTAPRFTTPAASRTPRPRTSASRTGSSTPPRGSASGRTWAPIVSSDTFYDPDPERHRRWAERGVLAVEMEAAVLFTIGALRGVETACILTVSDLVGGERARCGSPTTSWRLGVERMTRLALAAAVDARRHDRAR